MPEIDWDITRVGRHVTVAAHRRSAQAKEWNLIGALFDAATAERHDLVNRVCRRRTSIARSRRSAR